MVKRVMHNKYSQQVASMQPHMSIGVLLSLLLHGAAIFIGAVGLPHMKQDLPDMAIPISVELIREDQVKESKPVKRVTQPKTTKPVEIPPKPQMPTVTAKKPPKPVAPQRQEDAVALPSEDAPKEDDKPKAIKPPKVIPRKPTLTRATAEEENPEEFSSLLRNLMPQQPTETEDKTDGETEGDKPAVSMTAQEGAALRRQLSQCWSLLAGARYAEDLIVDIRLIMNPDRTIRSAKIVNQVRYFSDSYFQAAADGALRAVMNPRCNPLDLPPQKYDLWKTITITFDPRKML